MKVIVRPSQPQIVDGSGTVLDLYAGPYQEGSEVQLSCIVIGKKSLRLDQECEKLV